MGVSTSELGKMLEAGQVIAEDFLPKFAKQLEKELGQASADAAGTAARELNRLKNEFGDLVKTVADGGSANAIGLSQSTTASSPSALRSRHSGCSSQKRSLTNGSSSHA